MEEWREIEGCEGRYAVSNKGKVKSLHYVFFRKNGRKLTKREKELNCTLDKKGYMRIRLTDNSGEKKSYLIHRLVATAFIENKDGKPFVNHKDGNKQNNNVENLEWCTAEENTRHGWNMGLNPNNISCAIEANKRPVLCSNGILYDSISSAARDTGVHKSAIGRVCSGEYKQTHGMTFRFAGGFNDAYNQ